MSQVPELSPLEFRERWAENEHSGALLLDVREPEELAMARLDHAIHIPMREIPMRLGELARNRPIVIMCHSGARSRHVAEYLVQSGFDQVYNLAGGIDAWSREVDAAVPRY
jgi:rhodanese-related sulfurtransferase